MGILDFLTGEFIDVIHWTDNTDDTLVWRFEREDHEIKYGAKLTVREGQAAVFVHEGQLADVFHPGLYLLETNNMPITTTLNSWDHGFKSPFKSEIYFVNTTRFQDLKWGTKNPIICRDPEFGPVRLRAFGTFAIRVSDPGLFLREIVGTDGEFTTDEISFQIRNIIVSRFSTAIAASGIPVLDMSANTMELAKILRERLAPELAVFGIEMPEFYIENISLPDAVEAALDKRTSMGIVGDLGSFMQYSAAEALTTGAAQPGGNMIGSGVGAGMGMAMATQMATGQMGPWGTVAPVPTPPPHSSNLGIITPPPPPAASVEKVWHIADGKQTKGPYSRAKLGRMAQDGDLSRDTYVWTAGQDGWKTADEVAELAQLFTVLPPPPPES
jgi:membrane protease subunit (stomatin/prohibitin family)